MIDKLKKSLANRKWREKNKEYWVEYRKNHKIPQQKQVQYKRKHYTNHPWAKTKCSIIKRCLGLPFYKKKKIKYSITIAELKYLWFRDKAYLMKKPSIDRIDNNGHYTFSNCRYMEMIDNIKRQYEE